MFAIFLYAMNSSIFVHRSAGHPTLLAHRGIAQRFDASHVGNDTCTASLMLAPEHGYLENTIPSIRAGLEAGADVTELDVHPTTDGKFAVFHDWTLDCRTDGSGVTREHTLADLKKLDVGYGYTADGGKTFPFRGKGVGLMPSLDEVLTEFPDRRFLINVKSRDPAEGKKLAAFLHRVPEERRTQLMVSGGEEALEEIRRLIPGVQTVSRASLKACLLRYSAYGWTGRVPDACRNHVVLVPINVAPWLWGWPDRFLARMESVNSSTFVLGPYRGGDFAAGIDTAEDLARLPAGFSGGIWTNEIALIADRIRSR